MSTPAINPHDALSNNPLEFAEQALASLEYFLEIMKRHVQQLRSCQDAQRGNPTINTDTDDRGFEPQSQNPRGQSISGADINNPDADIVFAS